MAILEVRGLVKNYGRRRVVDGVDFEVDAGEVVGLLGPNGAGKTTSFRMTTGQITPYSGRVQFNGHDVTPLPMYRRARLGMGYLSQETSVFRKLTVEQNILAILEAMPVCRSLGRRLSRRERWERTDAVLEQFGLLRVRKNNAARLSGGEKRRLEIARCLVCEPLLILLDEPFTGIDPKTIADIQTIVRDLRHQGIGILMTDHNVREALKITDRSYLIKDGKVRTHGTPQEIIHDPIAISEYLGAGFNDNTLGAPPPAIPECPRCHYAFASGDTAPDSPPAPPPPPPPPAPPPGPAVHLVLEQEKIRRLIENLKTEEHEAAAVDLVERGLTAVPALLEALERRDVEMRRQAFLVLQTILQGTAAFDPYAPEAQRRQQIAFLRERLDRKAS
ncbi:MAG: LPS export ABC transporter ATP-binding protein [Planctomycetes bacterium]|nr:LPS export ABC transporter ATP-binding protein [Planctomycetota bacterium]